MTRVKLLLDEDVHFNLASASRKRGYDAIHVQELDCKGFSDREQLKYAVEQQIRVTLLVMRDRLLNKSLPDIVGNPNSM